MTDYSYLAKWGVKTMEQTNNNLLIPKDEVIDRNSCGVVIARFQVDELHKAHVKLIETVVARHKKVIIFLGVHPVPGLKKNPMDYMVRAVMMQQEFPLEWQQARNVTIVIDSINDVRCDHRWSIDLDRKIRTIVPFEKVSLYGSRDSFIKHYFGQCKDIVELQPECYVPSGTDIRREVSFEVLADKKFRRGIIYGCANRYNCTHPTVDFATFQQQIDGWEVLMGMKPDEDLFRFGGGFFDNSKDKSFEDAVKRERGEEMGSFETSPVTYVCSRVVEKDWRYIDQTDKILTTLFAGDYTFGPIKAGDDLKRVEWKNARELYNQRETLVTEEHQILLMELAKKFPDRFNIKSP